MKVLAAYSHKGGSGKTTALLMLAQAIMARGKNVLLVDCDPQVNFRRWKEESDPAHWPIGSEVIYCNYELTLPQVMTDVLVEANESGRFDYALLNLPGVDHPFNAFVLKYAELTLIPFKPGATELVELAPAVAAIRRLSEQDQIGEVRIVFAQTNDMTASRQTICSGSPGILSLPRLRDSQVGSLQEYRDGRCVPSNDRTVR